MRKAQLMSDVKDVGKLGIFVSLLLYMLVTIRDLDTFTVDGEAYNAIVDTITAITTVSGFLVLIVVVAVIAIVLRLTDRI